MDVSVVINLTLSCGKFYELQRVNMKRMRIFQVFNVHFYAYITILTKLKSNHITIR